MSSKYRMLIKENQIFQKNIKQEITYCLGAEEYIELNDKYELKKIAGERDLDKVINLLSWVNKYVRHRGDYDNSDTQDAISLLNLTYKKDFAVNCLSMSIILSECLLSVGVKSRVMYMMPQSETDRDSHVVVEAYVSEWGKWIMADPTYGSYCLDSNGNILNLWEIRKMIANDRDYYFSDTINYNGIIVKDIENVQEYYEKNLFFLRCRSAQGFGQHREYKNMLEIAPLGFDVHSRMVKNLQYRISTYGDHPIFRIWREYEENLANTYVDIISVYSSNSSCSSKSG